ncbi:DUF5361 domain-containing protein [Streptomyces sp. N35]|uniref:DUF5361 domain-containing protein n=1 Tax=Streptomyces sp. N35 TaxID=2795730 RepID=UPI0018F607A4|nr:DUF5361 domain-containing protein [Streptomyces sp. N35]
MLRGAPPLDELTLGRIGGLHEMLRHEPHSATARTSGGDGYTAEEHLLFLVVDELRLGNWMRTKDAQRNRNRPKPLSPLATPPGKRTGRTDRTPAEVQALLAQVGPVATMQ